MNNSALDVSDELDERRRGAGNGRTCRGWLGGEARSYLLGGFAGAGRYEVLYDPSGEYVGCGVGEGAFVAGVSERGFEEVEGCLSLDGEASPCLLRGFAGVGGYLIFDDPIGDPVGVGGGKRALSVGVFEDGYEEVEGGGLSVGSGMRR